MFHTALNKKRAVGLLLLVVILSLFLAFSRFPKLDTVRGDLDAVTAPKVECFQGFCIEQEPQSTFLSRWWDFSVTYLKLVAVGMTFAFLVAGLTTAFLFPQSNRSEFSSGGVLKGTLKGLTIGPAMTLCSACIVPVSAAFWRRGLGIEGTVAMVQGSSTLNIPAMIMIALVFTPLLGGSRILLSLIGALLIGPLVGMMMRNSKRDSPGDPEATEPDEEQENSTWGQVLGEALRDWVNSSIAFLIRLGPIMVVAGFASGLAIQWITPETVETYLGNNLRGVAIAATIGLLINVPLLFEIPLVALLLLLGMGTAPAATLLFAAAAGGPITFWGLATVMPKRAIATFATATWAVGAVGGVGILGLGWLLPENAAILNIRGVEASSVSSDSTILEGFSQVPPAFTDVAASAGVAFQHTRDKFGLPMGGGSAIGDYNGDGFLDIYVTNSLGANSLYRNNGDDTFADVAAAAGVDDPTGHGNGAGWGDYDNDGDLDLFVANYGFSKLFHNNGDGTFSDMTLAAGVGDPNDTYRTMGIAWGDYDQDGLLDLLTVRHFGEHYWLAWVNRDLIHLARPLALYHNNGNGTFTDVASYLGDANVYPSNVKGASFKPVFVDYDNDGDPDIYVVNDFGATNYRNVLWRNDGSNGAGGWKFTDVSASAGANLSLFGMGLALGDYDNDGDFDFYITNWGDSEFLENQGDGTFINITKETGTGRGSIPGDLIASASVGWGALFADLNNDGLLDLYYVAGYLDSDPENLQESQPNAVFVNTGTGRFVDVSAQTGADDPGIGREVVATDLNNDGLVDLFVVNIGNLDGTPGTARLFQNISDNTNNWLIINTIGTKSNRDGIGARITVTAGGVTRIREMGASQGHLSHSVVPVHFGLGTADQADVVEIRWPSGIVQTITSVAANQALTVTEPTGE